MPDPLVSIVVLNFNSPEVVDVCLRTLAPTDGVPYEVVVVDNGSEPHVVEELRQHQAEGRITTLVLSPENLYFSGGNNLGVTHTNPASKVVVLLNSDVAFLRPDWLTKLLAWMDGTIKYWPSVWGLKPATPDPGPRDIVSIGWSHDASVLPGNIRPEGWCLAIRREWWRDLDTDYPWHGGLEKSISESIRAGAKCGVLSQYSTYLVHMEGASGKAAAEAVNVGAPDYAGWFAGLCVESCDFCLGPDEKRSYIRW